MKNQQFFKNFLVKNPLQFNVSFLYPLKASEIQRFLTFSGGTKNEVILGIDWKFQTKKVKRSWRIFTGLLNPFNQPVSPKITRIQDFIWSLYYRIWTEYRNSLQRHIQNPAKNLKWSFLRKISLHLRCLAGFLIHLCTIYSNIQGHTCNHFEEECTICNIFCHWS